ncbi:MAG TPA: hypothetical protein VM305_11795 [Candidatus Limnocylindrales bacterium]|nr:hypothetical protein [Candidatus Limnocylindrales bacterium]
MRLTRKGLYELVMLDEAGDVVGYDLTHATLEAAKADAYQRFRDLEAADAVMASLRGHGWTCWRSRSPRRHPFTD